MNIGKLSREPDGTLISGRQTVVGLLRGLHEFDRRESLEGSQIQVMTMHSGSLEVKAHPGKRGAVLICVLVVLMLVGMMSMQAIQSLMIVRRSDSHRANVRQARELIELGKIAASDSIASDGVVWEISLPNGAKGSINLVPIQTAEDNTGTPESNNHTTKTDEIRIEAAYPANSPQETLASEVIHVRREN